MRTSYLFALMVLAAPGIGAACDDKTCTEPTWNATSEGGIAAEEPRSATASADPAARFVAEATTVTWTWTRDGDCAYRGGPCLELAVPSDTAIVADIPDPHGTGHFDLAALGAMACDSWYACPANDAGADADAEADADPDTCWQQGCTPLSGTLDVDDYALDCADRTLPCARITARIVIAPPDPPTDGPSLFGAATLKGWTTTEDVPCGGCGSVPMGLE